MHVNYERIVNVSPREKARKRERESEKEAQGENKVKIVISAIATACSHQQRKLRAIVNHHIPGTRYLLQIRA